MSMTYCDNCLHLYDTDFFSECPLCEEPFEKEGTDDKKSVLRHPNLTTGELEALGATINGEVAMLSDGRQYVPAHSREITNEWSRWK